MGVQNRGTLPALSHELAEFGQLGGGGSSMDGFGSLKPPINGAIFTPASGTTGIAPAIGTLDLGLLYLPGGTYSSAIVRVSTPVAGATVKLAAYRYDQSAGLGALLFETPAVAATNGGYLSIALTAALVVPEPGYPVWGGLVNQGSAASSFWYANQGAGLPYMVSNGAGADLNNTTPPTIRLTGVTAAAPASPTGSIAPNQGAPRFGMLRSA